MVKAQFRAPVYAYHDTPTHSLYVPRAYSAVAPKTDIIVACTHAYAVWCIDPLLNEVIVDVPSPPYLPG